MSDVNRINRNDLNRVFNGDLRLIKAFENIINNVQPAIANTDTDLGSVFGKANQAIVQGIKNERISKGSRVLTWLSM